MREIKKINAFSETKNREKKIYDFFEMPNHKNETNINKKTNKNRMLNIKQERKLVTTPEHCSEGLRSQFAFFFRLFPGLTIPQ